VEIEHQRLAQLLHYVALLAGVNLKALALTDVLREGVDGLMNRVHLDEHLGLGVRVTLLFPEDVIKLIVER